MSTSKGIIFEIKLKKKNREKKIWKKIDVRFARNLKFQKFTDFSDYSLSD